MQRAPLIAQGDGTSPLRNPTRAPPFSHFVLTLASGTNDSARVPSLEPEMPLVVREPYHERKASVFIHRAGLGHGSPCPYLPKLP